MCSELILNLRWLLVVLSLTSSLVEADYETNPFLTNGSQLPPGQPGQPPSVAAPGFVWIQVPINPSQPEDTSSGTVTSATQLGQATTPVYAPSTPHKPETVETVTETKKPSASGVIDPPPNPIPANNEKISKKCLKPNGQFPSDSCNKYINCWNGIGHEQECPNSLLFNPRGYCDFAQNVNCSGKPTGTSQQLPPLPVQPTIVPIPPSSGQSTHAPTWTASTVPSVIILPTITPVDAELKNKCLKPRGQFPSSSCNKYINCWDNSVIEQECPEGLLFSAKGYCDYAANVDCGERTDKTTQNQIQNVPETQKNETKGQTGNTNCPAEYGTYRDKNSCDKYYTCSANKVVASFQCPTGLLFNETLGVCDYSWRVVCDKQHANHGKENSMEIHKEETKNASCPLETGTFRNKYNCSQYYTCLGGEIVAKYDCPPGFSFSNNIGVCDYTWRVDCSKEPSIFKTAQTDVVLTASEQNLECPVEYGTFRDRESCSTYYVCSMRKIVAKHVCPPGFSFNDNIGVCDYARNVDCTESPKVFKIGSNNYLQKIPLDMKQKAENCTPGTVFRLNPQCTSACRCREGFAEVIQCPAGLAYDSNLDKCVSQNLAKC